MFTLREDDLTDPRVLDLLALHLTGMRSSSPPGYSFALGASGLKAPDVTVWTAWEGDRVVGLGALKDLGDGAAELKSMRTHPEHVRKGVGAAVLEHILGEARRWGMRVVYLETGTGAVFEPALALYRRRGFQSCGPFGDYAASDFNQFMRLEI